jgi:DNA polymerase-3 subunit delta'
MSHPDFASLRREWNPKSKTFFTEIRVDDVRAAQDVFRLSSAFGGWRVAIVDSADDLNKASVNALLKTIEEPPVRALILIVAHRPGRLPPTIRSRCRRLSLAALTPTEIAAVVRGQGPPWDAMGGDEVLRAASRADGSAREALRRLDPEGRSMAALIEAALAELPNADPRLVHKLADAVGGRAAADSFQWLTIALYDWLAARSREPSSAARLETLTALWEHVRAATRETEAYNLDRKLHVLAIFEEFAAKARAL